MPRDGQFEYFRNNESDPRSKHSCTDLRCCFVFVVALSAFVIIYLWSVAHGNVGRLYHGIDYEGHFCGVSPSVANKNYLYWCQTNAAGESLVLDQAQPICVDQCPGQTFNSQAADPSIVPSYQIMTDCKFDGAQAMASYKTIILLNRYCIPDTELFPGVADQIARGLNVQENMSSILAAWPVILSAFLMAIVLGYVYLTLLRFCAMKGGAEKGEGGKAEKGKGGNLLISMTMLLSIIGFATFGLYLWVHAVQCNNKLHGNKPVPAGVNDNEIMMTKVAAGICWVLSGVFTCLACCLNNRIRNASACMEVACDAIFEMPSLLLTPILKACFNGMIILILVYGFFELYSTGDIVRGEDRLYPHFEFRSSTIVMMIYYCFMGFWILTFISALFQFTVTYAIAEYYYTDYDHDGEKDVGCCAMWDGLTIGLRYHSGSLALGSLLITLLHALQKTIEFSEHRTQNISNMTTVCLLRCINCFAWCCKEWVEYMTKNALIDMAITSDNFCGAAKNAMRLITEIGGSMVVLNGATYIFAIFGIVIITLCCASFSHMLCSSGAYANHESIFFVNSPLATMVVSSIVAATVAFSFVNLFDMASDTLLYCYGLDRKNKTGETTAPQALKELVHDPERDTLHPGQS